MVIKTTPEEIYDDLVKNVKGKQGNIYFNLAGICFNIKAKDTVGKSLQEWLKVYFHSKDYYFAEPINTQAFPDFFLSENKTEHQLEIKSFHYSESPGFDIANFDSYCEKIKNEPFTLYADYLIFGYEMSDGVISIEEIWLKKIWEIAGKSKQYPLKTQIKKGMIYNIRPNTEFKRGSRSVFSNEKDFLKAIYDTIASYKEESIANDWKKTFSENYEKHYGYSIEF